MSIGFFVSLIIEMKAKGRSRLDTHYKEQVVVFKECIKWLNLSRHWFCEHIPFWFLMMETYGIKDKNVNVLELGRFEGQIRESDFRRARCVMFLLGPPDHG